ncbi:two-component sensor histidine kinase [Nonlabens arenilitoris]|uniref:histidine kinase n=1 Tax=Nonlabens arenilitoris TaxID=1217969 RepID=A0A2S7UBM2_9FLAO|nr:HAMP domain-containing sensor histidine kinase [Nonlabens arenilitoris]PQJ31652.1 two-component sensor histidine kinase [Nonlabens arenilitoris]
MNFTANRNVLRWVIIAFAMIITALILWNTYEFFQQLKESEQKNMKEYEIAIDDLVNQSLDAEMGNLGSTVTENTTTIPMIEVNYKGDMKARNLPEHIMNDTLKLRSLIDEYASQNEPIRINYDGEPFQTIYYGESPIITKMKYFPMALLLILVLFGAVIWFFYRSTKASEQNKLWAGMAKESAHQIGTPLSSLVGWTTLLKDTNVDPSYITEMEKDITRLQTITERFSKIGSIPTLSEMDIVDQTDKAVHYISSRSSKLVEFVVDLPSQPILVKLNEQLYAWVVENLIKNGIDAMKGKGTIKIYLRADAHKVFITVSDTGKGIPKNQWNQVFTPGFTTKKRGWGLGLSLAHRIIKDYHKGMIRVADSKKDKGTTFEIMINRLK